MSSIITKDPEVLSGMAVFAGTRVPVKNLFDYLKSGLSINDFIDDFPGIDKEKIVELLHQLNLNADSDKEAA